MNAARPFNRVPLWRRVTNICDALPAISTALFAHRTEVFARSVEAARHGHAHALGGRTTIQGGESLYFAAEALIWVLRACLMVDLGFPVEAAEARILRHSSFIWTARGVRRLLDAIP